MTLPDEIMTYIFETGHRMTRGCAFAKSVSHVSRRFRRASLRTPSLWTRISTAYADDQIPASLLRSCAMDLEVTIMYGGNDMELHAFFGLLHPSSNRWSRLDLGEPETAEPEHCLQHLTLPRLQTLRYDSRIDISLWDAPLLHRIEARHWDVSAGLAFHSQLTTFELSMEDWFPGIASLTRALYSMINLRELSLTLESSSNIKKDAALGVAEMLERRSVRIDALHVTIKHSTTYVIVEPLYDHLSYLSPCRFNITLENLADDDHGPATFLYDSDANFFPYGETISIRVADVGNSYKCWDDFGMLNAITESCSIAHTVHIDAPVATLLIFWQPHIDGWNQFSSLRHLRFSYCDKLTERNVEDLVTHLMDAGSGGSLELLEVLHCRGISEQFLRDICDKYELGQKLTWNP
ncbi:hypothetical protein BD410DRAFT_312442 [Rickenella mellea]|uniref:Uncharacterized protein n=1 Tax=Rickenella mellea TaxID=50990 RepID=A0A4Y7Q350_9AGAM|nr:hypothetical protein BD410DRAFT_312442 [Rickenella mellea]